MKHKLPPRIYDVYVRSRRRWGDRYERIGAAVKIGEQWQMFPLPNKPDAIRLFYPSPDAAIRAKIGPKREYWLMHKGKLVG